MTEKKTIPKTKKRPLIYERIAKVVEEIPAIPKDKTNQGQGWNFRSIDQVCSAVHLLLAKHHIFFTPHVIAIDRQIIDRIKNDKIVGKAVLVSLSIEYNFYCADDQSCIKVGPIIGEAADQGDKASNKAMSMALKYALIQLFSIPVEIPDADAEPNPMNGNGLGDKAREIADKKTGEIPPPNEHQQHIIEMIRDRLISSAPEGLWPDPDKIANAYFSIKGSYPEDEKKVTTIAAYFAKQVQDGKLCGEAA